MASTYFSLLETKLRTLWWNAKEEDDEERYCIDASILKMLCSCLEAREGDYTADAERKLESLRCLWVDDDEDSSQTLLWPQDIQDFDLDLVTFGLERKIQHSKTYIQQWCQNSSFSMQMQCNSSTILNIKDIMINLSKLLRLRFRPPKFHPFQNQIRILEEKLLFLYRLSSLINGCIDDSKELVEYRNFVQALSYNAVWLTCRYWANEEEVSVEVATEMNIALFDLLHIIKPCAAPVIPCYFAVLKSIRLKEDYDEEEDNEEKQNLASFVDFFFEDTVLKDDFLILRQHLILLFTFLADNHHDNTQEEEEEYAVICNQIYALLYEDAYLLVPIGEMKVDFSNNNMLLSDFVNKIEILSAKIIQLNYRPSDSMNRWEAQKMSCIYFEPLQRELSYLIQCSGCDDLVELYLIEVRFLRSFFFKCFETWDDSEEETSLRLHSVVTSLQRIWGHEFDMGLLSGRLYAMRKGVTEDLRDLLDVELKEKFHMSKREINAWLLSLSHCSFHCRPSTSNMIHEFLDSILHDMSVLVSADIPCKDVAFKKQAKILKDKLLLVNSLLKLATNCADSKNLEELNMLAQVFANNAACLIYLYWINWENDKIPDETDLMLSNMLLKIKPNTPHVARIYIGTLKAVCLQPYDSLLLEQTITIFLDYFFEDLLTPWNNDFQIVRDEVIFVMTFVHHHHTGNAEEIMASQLDVLFSDDVYGLLPFHDIKGDFSKKKVSLSNFLQNIRTENAKIKQLYCKFPESFVYSFPKIIGQGFLDCLLQKLRNLIEKMICDQMHVPSAKYKIMTIEQELVSLTSIIDQILELTDLNDAWLEVVNVLYLAEHVINLCFIFYHQVWHYTPYLSNVVDRIKVVKNKLEKIEACNVYNNSTSHLDGRMSTLLEQDWTSEMVGFERDEKIITDNITRGSESLDIVSIVGMGGLGKTTLAKKVYGSSLVKSHFNIFAFCYVSHDHVKRKILLDILRDIVGVDAKTSCMTEDDLAHKLKKCLSRQKYFIVLDDIWNINAWDEVKNSFPNDKNGSRVMFTTRSLEVAKRGQIKCDPYCLCFLTEEESKKLLQKKIFHNEVPPPNVSGVVELVAKKCNGLPLAIVVIAGLLARTSETSIWIEISKRVSSYIFDEGCMGVLELSYKHLPEYLKPCFLYLGAFPEDYSYKVQQLTMLWIAEGFIKESKTKSLNDVAIECLYELVDRSLIIVDEMTIGEIRTFRVHDLIHYLCRKKCQDNNFFQQGHGAATSSFSHSSRYANYRISVHNGIADAKLSLANTRSLLYCPLHFDKYRRGFLLRMLRFVQVLFLPCIWLQQSDFSHVTSLLHLRHIEVIVEFQSIPLSISNLWNMQSLILRSTYIWQIGLPESLWRMKSLRQV